MTLEEALPNIGQWFGYSPELGNLIGIKEALFLSCFIWWSGKQQDPDGWIYKTIGDITTETALSKKEQIKVRANLKEKNLIEDRYDRINHRLYYRVRFDELRTFWERSSPKLPKGTCPAIGVQKEFPEVTKGNQPDTQSELGKCLEGTSSNYKENAKITQRDSAAVVAPAQRRAKLTDAINSTPDHKRLIQTWEEAFRMQFDGPYRLNGGRDAKAVKDLLRILGSVEAVIDLATAAWSHLSGWHCQKAVTFHYLLGHINEIEAELRKAGKAKSRTDAPEEATTPARRGGTILAPPDVSDSEMERAHAWIAALNAQR